MLDPDKVRMYIRDRGNLNLLLNNEEQFEDEEIQMFEQDILEEITLEIPSLRFRKNEIHELILLYGVISKLLEAAAHQENRNQMAISDDNVGQIDFSNKGDKYFNLSAMYMQKTIRLAQHMAASSFYNEVWGSVNMPSADYEFYLGSSE